MKSNTKFHIVPKRDFGGQKWLINGKYVDSGFVVVLGGCNIMPGATWFTSISDALLAINVLKKVGYNSMGCVDSKRFWKLIHRVKGVTQRLRNENKALLEKFPGSTISTSYY